MGGFATRLFGPASMTFLPPHPSYNQPDNIVRLAREYVGPGGGLHSTLGDANKAAREIYKIASNNGVGLRVVLGQDTLAAAKAKLKQLQEVIDQSEEFSADLQHDA
jgi:hypothetical protein